MTHVIFFELKVNDRDETFCFCGDEIGLSVYLQEQTIYLKGLLEQVLGKESILQLFVSCVNEQERNCLASSNIYIVVCSLNRSTTLYIGKQ